MHCRPVASRHLAMGNSPQVKPPPTAQDPYGILRPWAATARPAHGSRSSSSYLAELTIDGPEATGPDQTSSAQLP
jgi:hypothetical protein